MANRSKSRTPEDHDDLNWLRNLSQADLLRLARFCGIEIGKDNLDRDELISVLRMARMENDLADAMFRNLTRPATAFDVKNSGKVIESRAAKMAKQNKQQLRQTRRSLKAEIAPLRTFVDRAKFLSGILTIVAGLVGLNLWNSIRNIGELETRMETSLSDAEKQLTTVQSDLQIAQGNVASLTTRLDESLKKASQSNTNARRMIDSLGRHTGIQMIGKSIQRLDRLRSMKLYHIRPLMAELRLDIEGDLRMLENLRAMDAEEGSNDQAFFESLHQISLAILDLSAIYKSTGEIDLEHVEEVRKKWNSLQARVYHIEAKLSELGVGGDSAELLSSTGSLARLRTTIYQVEAALAIQEYRASQGEKDPRLLDIAQSKCLAAIAQDASASMAYIHNGLISSLRISRIRASEKDPNQKLKEIELDLREGIAWYRRVAKTSPSPEVQVYALNGLAYMLAKTGDAYIEASTQPECAEFAQEYRDTATQLLDKAEQEINAAKVAAAAIDPVVLTTEADIEMFRLKVEVPEENEDKSKKYARILQLLKTAVNNGYTGYSQQEKDDFFKGRPHFNSLKALNPYYKDEVYQIITQQQ